MGEPLLTAAAVVAGHAALLGIAVLGTSQGPFRTARGFALPEPAQVRPLLGLLALYWGVVAVHLAAVALDPAVTAWVGRDYAPALYAVEGDAVAAFQAVRHPLLDGAFLVAYLYGYPLMIYFAPFFYLLHRDARALRLAAVSFALLYAMTLPFYLFLPISNPWAVADAAWYQGQPVAFRLGELWPDIVPSYWQFTTPDNEMPSLHAAISAMTALVAWRAGYRRFAGFAAVFAAAIPVASFAMGVHWMLDAVVGEVFAVIAVGGALRLAARWDATQAAPAPGPAAEAGP